MSSEPVLQLRGISKSYATAGDPVPAVDTVSLAVAAGELVALYGPSGSGKSTLLRIVAGLEAPDAGAVLVAGRDVTRLSAKDAAAYRMYTLGWVHQEVDLDEGATALENAAIKHLIASRSVGEGHRRVTPLLVELGLGDRLDHRAETLSAGERQRVMIAQALSLDPKVLLADEPTGHLNSRLGRQVLELLLEQTRRLAIATLLVTHDERAAGLADRVHVLEDGVLRDADRDTELRPWD